MRSALAANSALLEMRDFTPAGRVAFLREHEDVLWDYWRRAFQAAFAWTPRFITHTDLPHGARSPTAAAERIAERLIERLKRPHLTLDFAPSWEDVRTWYAWSVGKATTRLVRLERDRVPASPWQLPEWVLGLVERWQRTVDVVRDRTGLSQFEAEWLYATIRPRRAAAKMLKRSGDGSAWSEERAKVLLSSTMPRAGTAAADRAARTRRGAAAAFRFDLAATLDQVAGFDALREAYVGPVRSEEESPPLPATPVPSLLCHSFLEFACWLDGAIGRARRDPKLPEFERIHAEVLAVGLKKAAARLVPSLDRDRVEREWPSQPEAEEEDET